MPALCPPVAESGRGMQRIPFGEKIAGESGGLINFSGKVAGPGSGMKTGDSAGDGPFPHLSVGFRTCGVSIAGGRDGPSALRINPLLHGNRCVEQRRFLYNL